MVTPIHAHTHTPTGQSVGLYGRVCLSLGLAPALQRRHQGGEGMLPAHGFGVGDEVALSPMKGGSSGGGAGGVQQVTVCRGNRGRGHHLVGRSVGRLCVYG